MYVLKAIGAVFAGLVANVILAHATDTILEKVGVFPPIEHQLEYGFFDTGLLLLATAYRTIYGFIGSYVTAMLSPDHPLRYTLILAAIGIIGSGVGLYFMYDKSPAWYPISLMVVAPICAWLAAKLYERVQANKAHL